MSQPEDDKQAIHLTLPPRFYLLPGAAIIVGTAIGLVRGSRRASLRFLAENVHRPPTTVQGWYFYNKTKNYRVLLGGLKEAGADALKLGTTAAGWVSIEQGCQRAGLKDFGEVVAGVGTAGIFSAVYRLPWKATGRTIVLGLMIGCVAKGLQWSQTQLRAQVKSRTAEIEAVAEEGREDVLKDVATSHDG